MAPARTEPPTCGPAPPARGPGRPQWPRRVRGGVARDVGDLHRGRPGTDEDRHLGAGLNPRTAPRLLAHDESLLLEGAHLLLCADLEPGSRKLLLRRGARRAHDVQM